MRDALGALLLAVVLAVSVACTAEVRDAPASPSATAGALTTQPNGTIFTDESGAQIQAHGGGVLVHEGIYYWVGEDRGADDRFDAFALYRSRDLVTWTFVADILTQQSDPELIGAIVERPKLLYNQAEDSFVLWMHFESDSTYADARVAVATSPTVSGDYAYRGSFRPLGAESRDMTVFQDHDGTAYLVSSTNANADMRIFRLTADYTAVADDVATVFEGEHREAPVLFRRGEVYFLVSSSATGWDANQGMYATAADLAGPWSALQPLGDETTYDSQPAFVIEAAGSDAIGYIYAGDRWGGARGLAVADSDYVWLTLDFPTAATVELTWSRAVEVDVGAGTVAPAPTVWPAFSVVMAEDARCLDSPARDEGTALVMWPCTGAANQQWQVRADDHPGVLLRNRDSGLCVSRVSDGTLAAASCEASGDRFILDTDTDAAGADGAACLVAPDSTESGASARWVACADAVGAETLTASRE